MVRKEHNWNHIHRALLELGFKQVSTHNDKLFYKKGDDEVMLYKLNRIDRAVIESIAELINVSYDRFVQSYRLSYQRSLRK